MSWISKVILTALLAVVVHRIAKFVLFLGLHKPIYNHAPGPCHIVPGVVNGSEDVVTLSNGVSLITSGWNLKLVNYDPSVKGRILTFDFNKPEDGAKEVTIIGDFDQYKFNPLGLDAWEDNNTGVTTVFATNRWMDGASIEVFEFNQELNQLTHKKTIRDTHIYTPNDILATSANTFYMTNDGYFDNPLRYVEVIFCLPTGSVMYYDGKNARQVVGRLLFANGITRSLDKRYVYVGLTIETAIDIYEIQPDTSLSFIKRIHMASGVDNLTVDPDSGDVWLAAQYNAGVTKTDGRAQGGAHVLRVQFDKELNPDIREALMDDGTAFIMSSVASFYKGNVLVGSVMGKMLYCHVEAF